MHIIRGDEVKGVHIPSPFERTITLLLGPDKGGVDATRINLVSIPPFGKTGYHNHDRPEAIFVIEGDGLLKTKDGNVSIGKDTLIWAESGEDHQLENLSDHDLKLLTFFIPGFSTEAALYNQQLQSDD